MKQLPDDEPHFDTSGSFIMSSLSIWGCEHQRDRRECHDCFAIYELDRLIEGHFKQYYPTNNDNSSTRRRKLDLEPIHENSTHLPDTDTESSQLDPKRVRFGVGVGVGMAVNTVDAFDTLELQHQQPKSVSGILSAHEQQYNPTTHHALPEYRTIATDSICQHHTPAITDPIDYESKCDVP